MSQQRNPPTRLRRSHSYYSTSSYISIGEDHHDALEEAQPVSASTATTPLPWRQIVVIGLMRVSEPISLTLIFPFINDFIWDLGATTDRSKVGMYAGVVESLFSLMQFATVLQWARASDRLGRRPILLNGLLGSSISSLCIGFSTSFPMLVAARALSGALNGNVAIYKAVIGEISDRTNAARAFSVLPLTWSCGMVLGPLIGGYLSRPAHRYPTWFAEKEHGALALGGLWERYPYLLPCLMAACISWSSIVLGYLFLEETEPTIVAARKQRQQEAHLQEDERRPLLKASETTLQQRYTSNNSAFSRLTTSSLVESHQDSVPPAAEVQPTALTAKAPGIMDLLKIGHIRRIMLSYSLLALCSISLDSVNVLYFWEPILLGGLSFPSTITGTLMSSAGVLGVSIQLGLFPYLQRRLGTLPLFRYAIYGLLFAPMVMPVANVVARSGLQAPSEHRGGFEQDVAPVQRVIVLLLAATAMACKTASAMGFSCIIILVNQSAALAPGAQMGTLNGLAQMSSSAMFAVGPYAASSLFALTIERHLLGGYLIWAVLFAVALTGVYLSHGLLDVEKLVERGDIADEAANRRR